MRSGRAHHRIHTQTEMAEANTNCYEYPVQLIEIGGHLNLNYCINETAPSERALRYAWVTTAARLLPYLSFHL